MIINRMSGGSAGGLPSFTYTGTYTLLDDGDGNWRIKFLTSGTLRFTGKDTYIDVCMVGGGGRGAWFTTSGGGAAGSGHVSNFTVLAIAGNDYALVVGAGATGARATYPEGVYGADGGSTSAFGFTANGGYGGGNRALSNIGYGGDGGSGGGSANSAGGANGANGSGTYPGLGDGVTTREFGEASGTLYATGGNGKASGVAPVVKTANTGDGGDGGWTASSNGASGIIVIRNHRAA